MIGCLRTRVRKQPIIVLYFEFELVLKFYNLEARWETCSALSLPDHVSACDFCPINCALVNVYDALPIFTHIAGTLYAYFME